AEVWDPSDDAFFREGARLKGELEGASSALEALVDCPDPTEVAEARERYASASEAWMKYEDDLREVAHRKPGYLSMAAALGADVDTGDSLSAEDRWHRRQALEALMNYVTQDGVSNLGGCFKNFLAMVRKIAPQKLDGISQTDLAIL